MDNLSVRGVFDETIYDYDMYQNTVGLSPLDLSLYLYQLQVLSIDQRPKQKMLLDYVHYYNNSNDDYYYTNLATKQILPTDSLKSFDDSEDISLLEFDPALDELPIVRSACTYDDLFFQSTNQSLGPISITSKPSILSGLESEDCLDPLLLDSDVCLLNRKTSFVNQSKEASEKEQNKEVSETEKTLERVVYKLDVEKVYVSNGGGGNAFTAEPNATIEEDPLMIDTDLLSPTEVNSSNTNVDQVEHKGPETNKNNLSLDALLVKEVSPDHTYGKRKKQVKTDNSTDKNYSGHLFSTKKRKSADGVDHCVVTMRKYYMTSQSLNKDESAVRPANTLSLSNNIKFANSDSEANNNVPQEVCGKNKYKVYISNEKTTFIQPKNQTVNSKTGSNNSAGNLYNTLYDNVMAEQCIRSDLPNSPNCYKGKPIQGNLLAICDTQQLNDDSTVLNSLAANVLEEDEKELMCFPLITAVHSNVSWIDDDVTKEGYARHGANDSPDSQPIFRRILPTSMSNVCVSEGLNQPNFTNVHISSKPTTSADGQFKTSPSLIELGSFIPSNLTLPQPVILIPSQLNTNKAITLGVGSSMPHVPTQNVLYLHGEGLISQTISTSK